MHKYTRSVAVAVVAAMALAAHAEIVIWGGADGLYKEGSNWIDEVVPNTAGPDIAVINAGNAEYVAPGDFFCSDGSELQLNGGSWTQTGGISWIQMAGGTLTVAGGAFDQGTAQNIIKNATTTVQISAGSAMFNSAADSFDYGLDGSSLLISGGMTTIANRKSLILNTGIFDMSDGELTVTNELKPLGATAEVSGGTLNANLISFDAVETALTFSGGQINLASSAFEGIYSAGEGHIDFTSADATLRIENMTAATAAFLFTSRVRGNGVADINLFDITESDGGVNISLIGGPAVLLGDANNDGVVSADDFAAVQTNFGNTGAADGLLPGDANDDGVVSADDFAAIQTNFGNVLGAATEAAPIPEPATLSLLAIGAIAVMKRRRA